MEENNIYRLEEMSESMAKSLDNISKVVQQQKDLIEVIQKSKNPKAKKFKAFIEETQKQINTYTEQQKILRSRVLCLNDVLARCKENEEFKTGIEMLIKAIGMFE